MRKILMLPAFVLLSSSLARPKGSAGRTSHADDKYQLSGIYRLDSSTVLTQIGNGVAVQLAIDNSLFTTNYLPFTL